MKRLSDMLMGAMQRFSALDYALFKIMLFSVGVLVGVYCAHALIDFVVVIWIVAVVSVLYVCWRLAYFANKK